MKLTGNINKYLEKRSEHKQTDSKIYNGNKLNVIE